MKQRHSFILKTLFSLTFLFTSIRSFGQHTGTYDTSITFMSGPRSLSLSVPASYSAAKPAGLIIGLHGLGDNASNYRDGLVNARSLHTAFPNTILICPEAATTTADFYAPTGAEQIIAKAIEMARKSYNIDTTRIILQGFSLGGRAALRYGLENPATFKGMILNTPAVQGIKDAINGHPLYPFNYSNASKIPVYITVGSTDILYVPIVDTVFERLVLNNGNVKKWEVAGMGHNIPGYMITPGLSTFFDSSWSGLYDAELVSTRIARRATTSTFAAACLVRNAGKNTLNSISIDYTLNGNKQSFTWNGNIPPNHHKYINFPALTSTDGVQLFKAEITSVNSGIKDTFKGNNFLFDTFLVATVGKALPFKEGFEKDSFPKDWVANPSGEAFTAWTPDNTVSKTGKASISTFNTILIFDNAGRKEEILSPLLDLTSVTKPLMAFDVAFNYQLYTPPYFTQDTPFADTLQILVSTDGGNNFSSVYKKGGKDLATYPKPIKNPTSVAACFIDPADSNWRGIVIDLSPYATSKNAIVKFSYISALGGNICIDNVNFTGAALGIAENTWQPIGIFPNPASDKIYIKAGEDHISQVNITDLSGRTLLKSGSIMSPNQQLTMDVSALESGIYIVQVITENGVQTGRVVIGR